MHTKTAPKINKKSVLILLIAISISLAYNSNLLSTEKDQEQPPEEKTQEQTQEIQAQTAPAPEPIQAQTQPSEQESQQVEQKELSNVRVDFKYPNGTDYGTYNTPDDTSDDILLVPNDFAERRKTAHSNLQPHNYTNDPEPLLKVPDELVASIDKRVKTIDPNDPEAILKVAQIAQEEVLAFGPRYSEMFNGSYYGCVPTSVYLHAMLWKSFAELGLNAQSGLNDAVINSDTINHQDVWFYDKDNQQLYIAYTDSGGISKWEESGYYQHKALISGFQYEKMKSLLGTASAKKSLLFNLISAIDIEGISATIFYVTMTESDAKRWAHQLITNGLNEELFEIAWKIISFCESPEFPKFNLGEGGQLIDWILTDRILTALKEPKGLTILESSYVLSQDLDYWLKIACEGDAAEIARIKEEGLI